MLKNAIKIGQYHFFTFLGVLSVIPRAVILGIGKYVSLPFPSPGEALSIFQVGFSVKTIFIWAM